MERGGTGVDLECRKRSCVYRSIGRTGVVHGLRLDRSRSGMQIVQT